MIKYDAYYSQRHFEIPATLKAFAAGDIDPGNYVAGIGSSDNAIDVLKLVKETKIDGKAILYPHIRHTPLELISYWVKKQEMEFLNNRLNA